MLFVAGYGYGYRSGFRPATVGLATVILGLAMVGITIVLGG
jgi:VIT1/CCC1 family predicted Fe2+/Mn2+ transporter